MGQTVRRNYDRYTLEFKLLAVKLGNHPNVMSKHIAEILGIHPVMLYRWQLEHRRGELRENIHMKSKPKTAKEHVTRRDPIKAMKLKLEQSERKIKKLEKQLAMTKDDLDLIKKTERFFEEKRRKDSR
jgi:transposase